MRPTVAVDVERLDHLVLALAQYDYEVDLEPRHLDPIRVLEAVASLVSACRAIANAPKTAPGE